MFCTTEHFFQLLESMQSEKSSARSFLMKASQIFFLRLKLLFYLTFSVRFKALKAKLELENHVT